MLLFTIQVNFLIYQKTDNIMGTRHIHCLKRPNGGYRFQYLQFDGYPSYQLGRVLKDIMPKMNRMTFYLSFGKPTTKSASNTFWAFLDTYLTLRSFDSGHSIHNTWKGKMPKDVTSFGEKYWAEYIYIYDPVHVTLTVQSVGTQTSYKMPLLDEKQQEDMGFDFTRADYSSGSCNELKLKAFCKMVEETVQKR